MSYQRRSIYQIEIDFFDADWYSDESIDNFVLTYFADSYNYEFFNGKANEPRIKLVPDPYTMKLYASVTAIIDDESYAQFLLCGEIVDRRHEGKFTL